MFELLSKNGEQLLTTQQGKRFKVISTIGQSGTNKGRRVIRVFHDADKTEYARIYSCCWGHVINHSGTRIGGYSQALDRWTSEKRNTGSEALS